MFLYNCANNQPCSCANNIAGKPDAFVVPDQPLFSASAILSFSVSRRVMYAESDSVLYLEVCKWRKYEDNLRGDDKIKNSHSYVRF